MENEAEDTNTLDLLKLSNRKLNVKMQSGEILILKMKDSKKYIMFSVQIYKNTA